MKKFNIRKVLDGLKEVSSSTQSVQVGPQENHLIQETLQSEHFQLCKAAVPCGSSFGQLHAWEAAAGPLCVLLPVRQPLPAHYGVMKCRPHGCPSFPLAGSYGCDSAWFIWVGKRRRLIPVAIKPATSLIPPKTVLCLMPTTDSGAFSTVQLGR
ncbi:Syntaxin-binding protein 5 Lethal(2) giant larvae protein -like protein 3 Tomosyn-1 [Channa argus]|uniref:Syntaxin-binding protein 5 Lethal(2) giant larvae protein-like protein 3 Tomosyn-1 n=1 Tax=Channa argus TaxID=215402 RepID=A0A6G1QK91_CHAAH|nr:Syntaxin-binding protein 5 Lethal(2) giant larvae protein -like protein 3 Tomosyn-1 [Channa argus]